MSEDKTKVDVVSDVDNPKETTRENDNQHLVQVNHRVSESAINAVNLLDEKQYAAAEAFITRVMRSEKGGIKTVADGIAVLMRAQDLQLPFSTSLEHIHVINGKTGVDIHIIKALLLKAGVTWDCIRDYTPLYEYTDSINVYNENLLPDYAVKCLSKKDAEARAKEDADKGIEDVVYVYPVKFYKDFNGNIYREYQLNSKFGIVNNKAQAGELVKKQIIPVFRIPSQPIDYLTEYKFYRKIQGKDMIAIGRFSYNDAVAADMFSKDTYVKYARIMIGHRAFTYGAREIASDVIMGCYETTELKQVYGLDIDDQDVVDVNPS